MKITNVYLFIFSLHFVYVGAGDLLRQSYTLLDTMLLQLKFTTVLVLKELSSMYGLEQAWSGTLTYR